MYQESVTSNSQHPLPLSQGDWLTSTAWKLLQWTVIRNPYIPAELKARGFPSPKQALFLTLPSHEIFYGGAARGGKSCALLAGALQYVEHPGYNALLLRKTFTDLAKPEALIPMSHEWLGATDARWSERDRRWTFPSGATLSFGYLEIETDKYHYQSAAYCYVGFDELSHFSETQYTYLFSRLTRLAGSDIPIRMRAASNPGGVGHEWVRRRFVRPLKLNGYDRIFIPARLEDNPGVDRQAYEKSLLELDPVTHRQLRHGDWDIQPAGNMFKRSWFEIVDAAPVEVVARCRAWDLAATAGGGDYLVGTRMSRTATGIYLVEHVIRGQWGPAEVESIVIGTARSDGMEVKIRGEQEPAASGKIVAANWIRLLAGYDVEFAPSSGEKIVRWRPFSAQCAAGNVKLVRGPWNEAWLDEMERVPQDGVHDDQADSASTAFNDLALGFYRPPGDFGVS